MLDPREKKIANILVNHSLTIKKGDIIRINTGVEAKTLVLEVCKLILKKGAIPRVNVGMPGFSYTYMKYAPDNVIKKYPKIAEYEAKNTDGIIGIYCNTNSKELNNTDPKKAAARRKLTHPISEITLKQNNWVIFDYPTESMAQDADMSLEEFEDFVFNACLIDYNKLAKLEAKQKKILDKGKQVRILSGNTDLTFSIEGRTAITCLGHRNMPDGEVFIAPVESTTEGYIEYDFPAMYGGREVDNVRLEFKKGKVVKATAKKNEKFLHQMLDIDKGARYLGEFGWGDNFGIKQHVKQILFDEKIGGTIHLALGMAYKEGGGRNDSALHWDMIKDLRKKGTLLIDNKPVMKSGKFLF